MDAKRYIGLFLFLFFPLLGMYAQNVVTVQPKIMVIRIQKKGKI